MIKGLGIDICDNERFKAHIDDQKFLQKIFTQEELSYCLAKKAQASASLAARWAAKESFVKAIPAEIALNFLELAVCHVGKKPSWQLSKRLKGVLATYNIEGYYLSLSHEKSYSVAITIVE